MTLDKVVVVIEDQDFDQEIEDQEIQELVIVEIKICSLLCEDQDSLQFKI